MSNVKSDDIRFTMTSPQNLTGERLISLQPHVFLTTGNINIDIDNVHTLDGIACFIYIYIKKI